MIKRCLSLRPVPSSFLIKAIKMVAIKTRFFDIIVKMVSLVAVIVKRRYKI